MKTICLALLVLIGPLSTMADDERTPIVTIKGEGDAGNKGFLEISERCEKVLECLNKAEEKSAAYEWKQALNCYQEATDALGVLEPDEFLAFAPAVLMAKGFYLQLVGRLEEARSTFDDAIDLVEGKKGKGVVYQRCLLKSLRMNVSLNLDQWERVDQEYQELDKDSRENSDNISVNSIRLGTGAYLALCDVYLGRQKEAEALAEQILSEIKDLKEQSDVTVSIDLGLARYWTLVVLSRWDEALAAAQSIDVTDDELARDNQAARLVSLSCQAELYYALRQPEPLIALGDQFEKKYVINSSNEAMNVFGMIFHQAVGYADLGKKEEALAAIARAKKHASKYNLADCANIQLFLKYLNARELACGNKYSEALEAYSVLLSDMKPPYLLNKESFKARALYDIALLYQENGEMEQMKKTCERYIKECSRAVTPMDEYVLSQMKEMLK